MEDLYAGWRWCCIEKRRLIEVWKTLVLEIFLKELFICQPTYSIRCQEESNLRDLHLYLTKYNIIWDILKGTWKEHRWNTWEHLWNIFPWFVMKNIIKWLKTHLMNKLNFWKQELVNLGTHIQLLLQNIKLKKYWIQLYYKTKEKLYNR